MNPKKDKKMSVTHSITRSVFENLSKMKDNVDKLHGVRPNINPPVEAFIVENILPWLDFLENSDFYISYENFKKEYPKLIQPGV